MTAVRGKGVLAIWNGIAPGQDAEFIRWHVTEHIPERLSIPGFRRARRYVALEGHPAYFNFYEVDDAQVLSSETYLARLNQPSDWTQSIVPHFADTSRTLCRVVDSLGHGVGRAMLTLQLSGQVTPALRRLVAQIAESPDVCAVHLLEQAHDSVPVTQEARMRDRPDQSAGLILLIEGAVPERVAAVSKGAASDAAIAATMGTEPLIRGLYCLDFLMDCPDAVSTT